MNNLLLVGNGFDVAHRLHTSYDDFLTIMKFWKHIIIAIKDTKNGRNINDNFKVPPSGRNLGSAAHPAYFQQRRPVKISYHRTRNRCSLLHFPRICFYDKQNDCNCSCNPCNRLDNIYGGFRKRKQGKVKGHRILMRYGGSFLSCISVRALRNSLISAKNQFSGRQPANRCFLLL